MSRRFQFSFRTIFWLTLFFMLGLIVGMRVQIVKIDSLRRQVEAADKKVQTLLDGNSAAHSIDVVPTKRAPGSP